MTKILSTNLPVYHNSEHLKFLYDASDIMLRHYPTVLKIDALYTAFLPLIQREDEAYKKIVKSDKTELLHELDHRRDDIYNAFAGAVKQALRHFNPGMVAAAAHLKIVFDTYGNPTRKPYNAETELIRNLIQDLNGKYQPDLVATGLLDWATELDAANTAFDSLLQERFADEDQQSDLVMRDCRHAADNAYKAIVERVNALIVVEGATNYEAFVHELNGRITYYNNTIAIRKGRRAAGTGTPAAEEHDDDEMLEPLSNA